MSQRPLLAAVAFVLLLAVSPIEVRAQDPQSPAEDQTPSLTTEDVAPASSGDLGMPAGDPGAAANALDRLCAELVKKGASSADVRALRARIDGGAEVAFGIRFEVDAEGSVTGMTQDIGTGFESIDRLALQDLGRENGKIEFLAGFTDVRISIGIARGGVRVRASGTAPSVEKATKLESFATTIRQQASTQSKVTLPDIHLDRSGATLSFAVALPFELLTGARQ